MNINRSVLLAALPALLLAQGCKKEEAPKTTVPAVEATVQARPAGETAPEEAAPKPAAAAPKAAETRKPAACEKKDTWFSLPNSAGGQVDLMDYCGRAVMVMFFTETCPYCTKAAPFVEKMYEQFSPKGFGVLGVSLNRDQEYASRFAKHYGLTFPVAYGGGSAARQYGARGVPYLYLLKKDHTVYNVWAGYHPSMDEEIKAAIAEVIN